MTNCVRSVALKISRYLHETSYKYIALYEEVQSARTIILVYVFVLFMPL